MPNKDRPNVVVICIDTLRSDHLSCYGFKHKTSPNIDKIASEGVLVYDMLSPAIPTHPGHTNMFTGVDYIRHQIVQQGSTIDLDEDIKTLPEILQSEGYYTAAADNLGRWFSRGYDRYDGYSWEQESTDVWRKGEGVNAAIMPILDDVAGRDEPFYCFFHYWDPHTPYLPPSPHAGNFYDGDDPKDPDNTSLHQAYNFEPFGNYFRQWMGGVTDSKYVNSLYDAEIAYCDECLAKVFARMDELELMENTLLVITSDHGEELDEHGLWYDHHGLYETNMRVPLIMKMPDVLPEGQRLEGLATLMDLTPTVLDLVGLGDHIAEKEMDGRNLVPYINDDKEIDVDVVYIVENSWQRKRGIRTKKWKYFEAVETPDLHNRPPVELYDLEADPEENINLAEENPDICQEMHDMYVEWLEKRMEETGNADPQTYQGITLRRVGSMSMAVPTDMKLDDGIDDDDRGKMKGYKREE
ncbi:MAG: sulfatase [Candidatus Latescibacteria bacterium]|nr:sulfatase [Candidatus Latescibacterota bacterium]